MLFYSNSRLQMREDYWTLRRCEMANYPQKISPEPWTPFLRRLETKSTYMALLCGERR